MPDQPNSTAQPFKNKIAIAIAAREAFRDVRKGKPIAFQPRTRP